jgi:hypothetical protein
VCELLTIPDCSGRAIRVHHRRRMNIEGIGQTHEEVEERAVVDRLGDLWIAPPDVAQRLHLFIRDAVSMPRQRADELQQQAFCRRDGSAIKVAVAERLGGLTILLALQLQEPRMATQSIMTAIERRYVGRDHLVLSLAQGTI